MDIRTPIYSTDPRKTKLVTDNSQTKKNMGPGPSTKRLRAMMKMMTEYGITRYKDAQCEIEMAHAVVPPAQKQISENNKAHDGQFNFDNYVEDGEISEPEEKLTEPVIRDELGFSEEDYLFRSADT
tara:strand:- start:18388 stop:18765 length:378 start_codon:yes stop_codon:yes gene_type:complete